jgi:RNA polymerase sigma-70 factor (ECF subfamily)
MGRDFPTPIEEKENLADDTQDLQRFLQQRDDQRALRQALDHLPDAFRVCLALRWIEGLDYHSIAQATGMSLANVKTSIHRGRQELRHRIEKMGLYSNEEPRSEGESS